MVDTFDKTGGRILPGPVRGAGGGEIVHGAETSTRHFASVSGQLPTCQFIINLAIKDVVGFKYTTVSMLTEFSRVYGNDSCVSRCASHVQSCKENDCAFCYFLKNQKAVVYVVPNREVSKK